MPPPEPKPLETLADRQACPVKNRWIRRIGAAGFLFFLIKGLLWLTVPAAIAVWRGCAAG
jgi:hypothetical protein